MRVAKTLKCMTYTIFLHMNTGRFVLISSDRIQNAIQTSPLFFTSRFYKEISNHSNSTNEIAKNYTIDNNIDIELLQTHIVWHTELRFPPPSRAICTFKKYLAQVIIQNKILYARIFIQKHIVSWYHHGQRSFLYNWLNVCRSKSWLCWNIWRMGTPYHTELVLHMREWLQC